MPGGWNSRATGQTQTSPPPSGGGGFGSRAVSPPAAAKKGGGGGILGALGGAAHFVAKKAELAGHDIKSAPGGIVDFVNTGVVQPYKDVITTGHVSAKHNAAIDKLTKQTADSTVTSFVHPLRDPFQTLLNVAPAAHGIGVGLERGAAAADAARAGKLGEAGKALVRKPAFKPRLLKSGEGQVSLLPSKNAGVRIAQRAYDRVVQHGLDTNPQGRVAAHGQRRIGGALDEEARIQQRMRAVPAARLDRAATRLSKTPGARREEQAALELASANTTPAEAAAYHFRQADKGVNPAQNQAVGKLYERVHDRGLLRRDENHNVVVNAADHPKLARADAQLQRVQTLGDKTLVEKGIRGEEALASRRNAPARIRAGATFEKPTPGKAGISPALVKATAERDRIAALHEKALAQEADHFAKTSGGRVAANESLDTIRKAHPKVELAASEAKHGITLSMIRTAERGAGHARAAMKDLVDYADRKGKPIALTPEPVGTGGLSKTALRKWYSSLGFRRNAGSAKDFNFRESMIRPPRPGALSAANPYHNRISRLSSALEVAQSKVDRIQSAAEKRVKPTGIVGGETARPGRGYVSARISEKKLGKAEASASRGPVIGATKAPIDAKTFTGRSIEQGLVPKDVTGAASRHYRQILRFVNTDARRRAALQTGGDVRRSNRDVLVRNPDVPAEKLSTHMQQVLGREQSTVDTAHELGTQEGLRAAHQAYIEDAIPSLKTGKETDAVGTPAPAGYKWVDKGALGELAHAPVGPRSWVTRQMDSVNSAVTAATVYFKVGHLGTREFTNAATNIIQGSATPLQIKKSLGLWHALSEEDKARALAAAGQHGFAALPHEGVNLVAKIAGKGAQWWARRSDAPFRFNSLAFEARKSGYATAAEFRTLLDHLETGGHDLPAHTWAKASAVARRADREAIAYDRLNNFERRYITRAFWFYPWTKGATSFAGHTLMEHPYKAAALGAAGAEGRKQQGLELGDLPSYEGGLFKVGGSAARPMVADFSTFSPFATPADVLDAVARPSETAGFLNPVYGAGNSLINGITQSGGKSTSPVKDSLAQLFSPTPESQILTAYLGRHQSQAKRMFPKSPDLAGTRDPLLRALLGPGMPRRLNPFAAHSAAARERTGR